MAMGTVLTVRTEELDPTAPPTMRSTARADPLRPAATKELAMRTATPTTAADEADPTLDGSVFTTKISRRPGPGTRTRTPTALSREEDGTTT